MKRLITILKSNTSLLALIMIIIIALPSSVDSLITYPENTVRFLLISIFSLIWIIYHFKTKLDFPTKPLILLLTTYYIYNLISSFWSLNPSNSIIESQRICLGIITIIIFNSIFKVETKYITFLKSYLLFSLALVLSLSYDLITLKQYSLDSLYEINSFFIHKNILASFLFLSLAITSLSIVKLKGKWKTFSILITILLLSILLILFNRTTYIALFVSGFTFLFIRSRHKNRIIVTTLIALIALLSFYSYTSINTENQTSSIESTHSFDERIKIWDNTLDIIQEHPLLGVGAGNWQYNFLKYSVSQIDKIVFYNTTFQKPHNDYLWILSELGIVGIILFLLILFFIFKPAFKPIFKERNLELSIILSFILGLALISFFSFPKERVAHICLTSVLISILLIRTTSTFQIKHDSILKYLILLIICFNLMVSFFIIKGQYYTTLMLQEKQKNNPTKVIEFGEKSLSIFYNTDETSTPISSYIGWASLLVNDKERLNYHTYNAYCISPYDFEVLNNYAVVLLKNRQLTEAKTILLKAYKINRYSEQVLINLFVLEYNIGNYEQAYNWLIEIKNYKVDYPMETEKVLEKMDSEKN